MSHVFELKKIVKNALKDVQLLYLTPEGEWKETNITRNKAIVRLYGQTPDDWHNGDYYLLLSEKDILQQANDKDEKYIYMFDNNMFKPVMSSKHAKKDKEMMAKLDKYSRNMDMLKRFSGDDSDDVDLSNGMFTDDKIKIKVKQDDKEFYCQYINDYIMVDYNIYIFRKVDHKVVLEPVNYKNYFYRFVNHNGTGNSSGWLAIPNNPVVVIENASDICEPSECGKVYIYRHGIKEKTYSSMQELKNNIDKYETSVCNSTIDEWIDFDKDFQVFVETE